jgi:dihydroneopterin aldolase
MKHSSTPRHRGVLAYHEVMETLAVHVDDAGHFLLETHASEVAALLAAFVDDTLDRAGSAARWAARSAGTDAPEARAWD